MEPAADLNALDPAIWPRSATRATGAGGALQLGGVDVRDLAAEHGTPAFVLDEAEFRARCRAWREAFAGERAYYGGKAFLCGAVARWVADEDLGLDVCTGGELAIALRAGFPADRMAFHGNNKAEAELAAALDAGIGHVIVDSYAEIDLLGALAEARGRRQQVLVRVTVGVEAHTHEFIATAHEDQKFGFSLASGDAAEAVRRVLKHPALELVGLHSHIGSQILDAAGFELAARRMVGLYAAILAEHGVVNLPLLDLGGGVGIAYVPGDDPLDVPTYAGQLRDIVDRECEAAGVPTPQLAVEPGRAIAGPSAVTLYEIGTVKKRDGLRTYVSVDGGMSDNIRTVLYDAEYTVALANRRSDAEPMLCRVVGKHCETGDVVVRDAWLPADLGPRDLLAVAATGAYCRALASNYNHVPRPPVVAVAGGASRVVVRRETVEDLLRLDVG
jgi:diaminopimelate decarboxylase